VGGERGLDFFAPGLISCGIVLPSVKEPTAGFGPALGCVGVHHVARFSVDDDLLRPAVRCDNDGQAQRLRFQHRHAKGVGEAGEQQDIGEAVDGLQQLAVDAPGEADAVRIGGERCLERGALGAVAR